MPIRLEDGTTIRSLADARDVILQLPDKEIRKPQWQALAGLLLSAATTRQHHLLSILTVRLETELPRLAHTTEIRFAAQEAAGAERKASLAPGEGAEAEMSEVGQAGQVVSALIRLESSVCQEIIKAASKQKCRPRGIVIVGDVTHDGSLPMSLISKILAVTMFLLAAWTGLGLTGTQRALAEPPEPCLFACK